MKEDSHSTFTPTQTTGTNVILTTRSMELSAGSSLGVEQRLDQSVTRVERTWCDYK